MIYPRLQKSEGKYVKNSLPQETSVNICVSEGQAFSTNQQTLTLNSPASSPCSFLHLHLCEVRSQSLNGMRGHDEESQNGEFEAVSIVEDWGEVVLVLVKYAL
jgi:hypothetical protein